MGKLKKVGIILAVVFVASFVILISAALAYDHDQKVNHPEEYEKRQQELEKQQLIEEQKRKESEEKAKADERIGKMEEEQERLLKEIKLARENEELQKQIDERESEKTNEYRSDSSIEFDPGIVSQAEQSIPSMQSAFRMVLDKCNSVNSYSDYRVFADSMALAQDEVMQGTTKANEALTVLELLGYDKHSTVGPLIKETRQLAGKTGDCIIDLQNMYGK